MFRIPRLFLGSPYETEITRTLEIEGVRFSVDLRAGRFAINDGTVSSVVFADLVAVLIARSDRRHHHDSPTGDAVMAFLGDIVERADALSLKIGPTISGVALDVMNSHCDFAVWAADRDPDISGSLAA